MATLRGRYRFVRDLESTNGFLSRARPSTDAVNALQTWTNGYAGRSYRVISDNNELVAELTWPEADRVAGPELEDSCRQFGVERLYVEA
jgi:hypothetical protein